MSTVCGISGNSKMQDKIYLSHFKESVVYLIHQENLVLSLYHSFFSSSRFVCDL